MSTDKARTKVDKQLKEMETRIGRVYRTHPALLAIEKKYEAYMKFVKKETEVEYSNYQNETDPEHKKELKKIYADKVDKLTRKSKKYNDLIQDFVSVMAMVNQEALDIVNTEMRSVYVESYNQVAEECKKVGIKVNG